MATLLPPLTVNSDNSTMPVGTPTEAADEPLVLGGDSPTPLAPDALQSRATRFKYGLGDLLGKTRDEIYQNLADGQEDQLRMQAATTLDDRKRQAAEKLITQTTANKQAPLTDVEKNGLIQIVQGLQKDTDPNTVLETAYGKQFMGTLDRIADKNPDNLWTDVLKIHPEYASTMVNSAGEGVSKIEVIKTLIEDADSAIKDQSYVGYGYDIAKTMIPGYQDYQMRGLAPGVGQLTGIGLGQNLEEQRKALLRLPTDEMTSKLKEIVQPLMDHNPMQAKAYLEAMKGQAPEDVFINNFILPVDIAGTGVGGKIGKMVSRFVKGSKEETIIRDAKKAVDDTVRASADPNASKSTVEAAAGDLPESAVTRATTDLSGDRQGLPRATERGIEALTSTQRADEQAARANPGQYGQDIVNRIFERGNSIFNQLIDTAVNIQKNERLPEVLSNESTVRLIVEDMKLKYRGLKNSIIDLSKIYREPLSNTYLIDYHLGNADGSYFASRSVAENFIKFHGLGDAEIAEGQNVAKTRSVVTDTKFETNIKGAQDIIDRERGKMSTEGVTDAQKAKSAEQIGLAEEYIVDQAQARIAARQGQTATVEQQGLGYYVKVTKPIDETRPVIREALAQTANTQIPDSPVSFFLNNWIGRSIGARAAKYRTPEEVLSKAERQNRLTTTYAPNEYFRVMEQNANEIRGLQAGRFSRGRKRWEEWQRGLENAQELPDANDPSRKGYFFQSPGEMETYWQQWFQRLPDQQEIAAYFEFKRGMEIDRVFRNIAEVRNRQRLGFETHNILLHDAAGKELKSPDFVGKLLDRLPGSTDNIAIYTTKAGEERVKNLSKMSTADKSEMQKDIDRGLYKLVEDYKPDLQQLSGFSGITDERIRYHLVPQLETKGLDWNYVPRRGGGHVQYDYDFYLKQAKIKLDKIGNAHWYDGDTTIMGLPTQGIGKRVAEHLNEIRGLLKDGKLDEARDYSNKHMHVDWKQVQEWFGGYKDEYGKFQPPRLSLDEDIRVVPKNRKITDLDNTLRDKYTNFRDSSREGSAASQNGVAYTQERDAFEMLGVDVEGTKANPLYKVGPASRIDPITTMNRGFTQIARSSFMDDYKTMAVEHWLRQAAPYMDVKKGENLYHAPYYFFSEGKFLNSAPPELRYRLEAAKYHIEQLTGTPSLGDAWLHNVAQKLSDSAFGTFGPKGLVITPTWLLPKLRDPFAFLRQIAFHPKLGMFNLPQFIVQAGNYANILGIAGYKYASPGTMAAQLHFWSTVNSHPNIITHLDAVASKFHMPGAVSWKPGEFKEAFEELNKTGFGQVGNEYAMLDDMKTNVIKSGTQTFFDWGTYPFKAGERNARYGAWYTAFKEFRDVNPIGRITNEDRAAILQRADLLNVNMSRASSSAIHKGVFSIPTQFYTYQLRLMELMFGTRLSTKERLRLFTTNAALFGVPMATGLTGIPVADYMRQKALEYGYVVGDDYLQSMLMEGIPSAIIAMATGGGDPQAGTWYDVGPRFGTKGFEFLGSANNIDKGWLDIAGGPAWSILKNTYQQSDGLRFAIGSMMHGGDDVFPPTVEDVADVLKEITSFNSAWRVYAATNFGRWVSKKDAYLADTSQGQAIFGALAGVKDVGINDIQTFTNSIKEQANYEKQVEEQFRQEFRRGVLAQNDNPELAKRFFTRATAWLEAGGYREDRISSVVSKALSDNQSVLDKTRWDFYIRKAPDVQSKTRYEAMQKTLRIQDKKNGNTD